MELKVAGPIDDAFLRIDRAGQHLANLKRRVNAYVNAEQGSIALRVEDHEVSLRGMVSRPPPRLLGVLIGETVQNLRTALDYLVFALAWFDSGPDSTRKTQFPIEDTPLGFNGRRNTWLRGLSHDHVTAIERLQPYNGGQWLATLRDLSNLDKHNVLPVAEGVHGASVIPVGLSDEHAESHGGFRIPGDEVGMYYAAPLVVTFHNGTPVIQIMELLKSETRSLIEAFQPEFEGWETKARTPRVTAMLMAHGPLPE